MTNNQMREGRYLKWHIARQKAKTITDHLKSGGSVVIATYTKAWQFDPKHISMIRATRSGLYMQRGNNWDCIDHAGIRFSRKVQL